MSAAFSEKFTLMIELVDVKQKELADYIGVHQSLISKCKKGERQLPRSSFEKIPEALKEMGKWRKEYDEPWAELWLLYIQETGADVDWHRAEPTDNPVGHNQLAQQVDETSAEADISQEEIQPKEMLPFGSGLLTPPDTVQRLSALLKEPYSLIAILLLIVLGLFARGNTLISIPSLLPSFEKQNPAPSETASVLTMPVDDSEPEDDPTPDPTSWVQEKQTTSNGDGLDISASTQIKWDFETDLDGWFAINVPDAEHSIHAENGELCSEIVKAGIGPWDLTMRHDNIALSAQTVYRIAFDVRTTVDRHISLGLLEANGIYAYSRYPLTAGTQSIQTEIRQNVDDADGALVFWVGGQLTGEVCIDNIVLSAVDTFEPSPAAGEVHATVPENLLPSADFATGYYERMWWLHQANGAAYEVSVRDGALCATVRDPGAGITDLTIGNRWSEQVVGTDYRLAFDVFSDGITSLRVQLSDQFETLELAPDWSVAEVQYSHTKDNLQKGIRLRFGGQPNGTICFNNFLLVES